MVRRGGGYSPPSPPLNPPLRYIYWLSGIARNVVDKRCLFEDLELKESMKNSTMNYLLKYNSVQVWCWVFVTSGFMGTYVV